MKMTQRHHPGPLVAAAILALGGASCSSSADRPASSSAPPFQIVVASGAPLQAFAGDAPQLKVVETTSDGGSAELPAGASVAWTLPEALTALPPDDDTDPSPLPLFGAQPAAAFIDNPGRPDQIAASAGLLYLLDPGTVQNATLQVTAAVGGVLSASADAGQVTASIGVSPAPAGDWTRGAQLYGAGGANCAQCHGATGHGSDALTSAGMYIINGLAYDFPAPGLNAEPGNLGSDPAWNAALLAVSARSDVDNGGVTLRLPMPDWWTRVNPATGAPLTTQDFADIYAFLRTQIQ
jgi:mono/diheme cytochrome c family protein